MIDDKRLFDVTWRPGLAYQHAFDWLAVHLNAAGMAAAYSTQTLWQTAEIMHRLPNMPLLLPNPADVEQIANSFGYDSPRMVESDSQNWLAVGIVTPSREQLQNLDTLLEIVPPNGSVYTIVGGLLNRFMAEQRNSYAVEMVNETALVSTMRTAGFRVRDRLGLHTPTAAVRHYLGEISLKSGHRERRDRYHYAMRCNYVSRGYSAGLSALVCLVLEHIK